MTFYRSVSYVRAFHESVSRLRYASPRGEMSERKRFLEPVDRYYSGKLEVHGATPQGVDWNSAESQELRFEQLLAIRQGTEAFSLNDYGCGYGALVNHMRRRGLRFRYRGFDVSASMIEKARELCEGDPACEFTADETRLEKADYTVASGIFNVRLECPEEKWRAYVLETLEGLAVLSARGFAFNALTSYSDPDRRRADLHYADPMALFDHCKRRFSRRVALLHDYPLWEFTILVRL